MARDSSPEAERRRRHRRHRRDPSTAEHDSAGGYDTERRRRRREERKERGGGGGSSSRPPRAGEHRSSSRQHRSSRPPSSTRHSQQRLSAAALAELGNSPAPPPPVAAADRREKRSSRRRDGDRERDRSSRPRRDQYEAVEIEVEEEEDDDDDDDETTGSSSARQAEEEERRRRRRRREEKSRREASSRGRERRRSVAAAEASDAGYETAHSRRHGRRGPAAAATTATTTYRDYSETEYETAATPVKGKKKHGRKKSRMVSGAIVEEGRGGKGAGPAIGGGTGWFGLRGGAGSRLTDDSYSYDSIHREKAGVGGEPPVSPLRSMFTRPWANKKKKRWIIAGCLLVILIIIIAVAVTVSKNNSGDDSGGDGPDKSGLDGTSESDIPAAAKGTYLDPFTWYETTDLNVTYTNETVGGLPVMGLFTKWDDSAAANDKVPAIKDDWGAYAKRPARGVNLGGWLSLEPFITPSLFDYDSKLGIIDEWTLCSHLGPRTAASTLEKHYATFVTEQDFSDIAAAGLDHVRIPYSYWAVQTYDDDPYVFRTSWRYLLRGIEWARKHGLRVKLDLHALPGSQNGWNHSGRQGPVGWLNGTDGELNRQRSLDVHDRLSAFFAQDRYADVLAFYGLANEPRMVDLPADAVTKWTGDAYELVRRNGIAKANIVFGDGFMGLPNWQGKLTGYQGLVLDVHQYVIFNNGQIDYTHQEKVQYACKGWTQQTQQSMSTSTGFGPTMFAEWSQADTDCARHVTNVGWGNRWTGTYDSGNSSSEALTPMCPAKDSSCDCGPANADPGSYSDPYRKFLKMFAEAQMVSFEKGWGWWYWTWDTESAPQWSYKKGLAAGILPEKAYDKDFNCDTDVPDFGGQGLAETF